VYSSSLVVCEILCYFDACMAIPSRGRDQVVPGRQRGLDHHAPVGRFDGAGNHARLQQARERAVGLVRDAHRILLGSDRSSELDRAVDNTLYYQKVVSVDRTSGTTTGRATCIAIPSYTSPWYIRASLASDTCTWFCAQTTATKEASSSSSTNDCADATPAALWLPATLFTPIDRHRSDSKSKRARRTAEVLESGKHG
jgi:hypothetical protein